MKPKFSSVVPTHGLSLLAARSSSYKYKVHVVIEKDVHVIKSEKRLKWHICFPVLWIRFKTSVEYM